MKGREWEWKERNEKRWQLMRVMRQGMTTDGKGKTKKGLNSV